MKNFVLLSACLFVLAACGTSTNIVKQSAIDKTGDRHAVHAITIAEANHTVDVPADMREHLKSALEDNLYQHHQFQQGNQLTLRYRFISYKKGDRLKRWLSDSTGSWGEGSLVVQTQFLDQSGTVVAEMETEGRIDSGIFGGAIESAANRVAEDLAQYAANSFK